MTVFITGGCKNGKSSIAERICNKLADGGPLYYVATMEAFDEEDRERIRRHVAMRDGKGFITLEQPKDILKILDKTNAFESTYMLDSVTALMINELYESTDAMGKETYEITMDPNAPRRVSAELIELGKKCKNIVFVSDYIYMDNEKYNDYTKKYLEALAYVDRTVAGECDTVCEVTFGNAEFHKGYFDIPEIG